MFVELVREQRFIRIIIIVILHSFLYNLQRKWFGYSAQWLLDMMLYYICGHIFTSSILQTEKCTCSPFKQYNNICSVLYFLLLFHSRMCYFMTYTICICVNDSHVWPKYSMADQHSIYYMHCVKWQSYMTKVLDGRATFIFLSSVRWNGNPGIVPALTNDSVLKMWTAQL